MEGIHMLKDLLKAGDWMAMIDLKGTSLHDSHSLGGQSFPQVSMEGPDIPVQLSPVRLSSAPWVPRPHNQL